MFLIVYLYKVDLRDPALELVGVGVGECLVESPLGFVGVGVLR
jgi:hypothetical protein